MYIKINVERANSLIEMPLFQRIGMGRKIRRGDRNIKYFRLKKYNKIGTTRSRIE